MTKNDITGDSIRSKVASEKYLSNWDAIFNKVAIKAKWIDEAVTILIANGVKEDNAIIWALALYEDEVEQAKIDKIPIRNPKEAVLEDLSYSGE